MIFTRKPKRPKAIWTTVPGALPVPTADKVAKAPKARQRIKQVSANREEELREYRRESRKWIKEQKAQGIKCPVTGRPVSEVHHSRGRVGSLLNEKQFWVAVSRQGHYWIHENPMLARMANLLAEVGDWNKQV